MNGDPLPGPAEEQLEEHLEELLDAWVAAREAGLPDVETQLLERAGEHAGELRARMDVLRDLVALGGALEQAREPELPADPTELGRFVDLVPLGEGGVSRVYVGRDPKLGRNVAIKVLDPRHTDLEQTRRWMDSEGRALASVEHPAVVRLFEVDQHDGLGFAVMELVRGVSLHAVVQQLRAWRDAGLDPASEEAEGARLAEGEDLLRAARALGPLPARVAFVAELAGALHACHQRGVVHRDVKPGNVLVQRDGSPKLIDFGLAHLEDSDSLGMTQRLVGTPGYLAPEQVDGQRTGSDPRSDQFSLGVLLYELLTLQNPFLQETRAATLAAISSAAPPDPRSLVPSLPRDLALITLHALERDPQRRYPSMHALANDLHAQLEYRAVSVASHGLSRAVRRMYQRNRRVVHGAAAAVLLSALLLLAGSGLHRWEQLQAIEVEAQRLTARVFAAESIRESEDLIGETESLTLASEALGRSRMFPTWSRSSEAAVAELKAALASHVVERMARDYQAASEGLGEAERMQLYLQANQTWYAAVRRMERLTPDNPELERLRAFGTVGAPEGTRLYRREYRNGLLHLVEQPRDSPLATGLVRAVGPDFEVDLNVKVYEPRSVVDPAGMGPSTPERVRVPGGEYAFGQSRGRVSGWSPAFEISPEPLRWPQVLDALGSERVQFLREAARRDHDTGMDQGEELARLSHEDATRVAHWYGLRLPDPIEVLRALDSGALTPDRSASAVSRYVLTGSSEDAGETFHVLRTFEIEEARSDAEDWVTAGLTPGRNPRLLASPTAAVIPLAVTHLARSVDGPPAWSGSPDR